MTGWNIAQDEIHIFQRQKGRGSCEFAMLSSCTDSATELATICSIVEIFLCRYSRMMKSSNSALVPASAFQSTCSRREFENNVGIYFYFLRPAGNFTLMKSHTRLAAAMSSAEPQPPSLLPAFWYRMCACT